MAMITCYSPMPITFSHGEGIWLYDESGKAYLDALTGIAVCGLGHTHPDVTQAIQAQAEKLLHTSNGFIIREQEKLAERLTNMTGMSQVFFCNSGAEANEAAIKLARLYARKKNLASPKIIVMEKAFHGRTMATVSASGNPKIQHGFEPLMEGFLRVPFNDIDAIKNLAAKHKDIVAIMLEPIQGEGGIHPAKPGYLTALSELCEQQDWLLMLDEIQSGNARTGWLYAFMEHGFIPDVMTTAKGLGNGFPIGACLMHGKATDLFTPGSHGSTFGGNPLACATALAVLKVFERDNMCAQVQQLSAYLFDALRREFKQHPMVKDIRGQGLLIGIELDRNAMALRAIGLQNGIIFNITAEKVIRLLPPFIMTEQDADELVKRLAISLEQFAKTN